MLADAAVLYAGGGGKRAAALDPIRGKENILRLLAVVVAERGFRKRDQLERASINGLPASWCAPRTGSEARVRGKGDQIVALYAVRNPDKLLHRVS